MKKPKKPPTEDQIADSKRLAELFSKNAGMGQLDFGLKYEIGNQGMVWQYLNAGKPKGSVLNVSAAIKFARGLNCRVSDFSPKIQEEINMISSFSNVGIDKSPQIEGDVFEKAGARSIEKIEQIKRDIDDLGYLLGPCGTKISHINKIIDGQPAYVLDEIIKNVDSVVEFNKKAKNNGTHGAQ